jgi:hypothetical protein
MGKHPLLINPFVDFRVLPVQTRATSSRPDLAIKLMDLG